MNRQITVANTKTQRRERFESTATTLGELKAEMNERGIDYSGMSFTEGLSKTVLLDDASPLPSNLMYKGQPTNDLVILLTNTEKKISSGMDRKEAFQIIKENNLQDAIQEEFGKNYTNVTTQELVDFINDQDIDTEEDDRNDEEENSSEDYGVLVAPHKNLVDWFYGNIKDAVNNGILVTNDIKYLEDLIEDFVISLEEDESGISNADIDDMIESLL